MAVEPTELHTERLLLRPFELGDVEDVLAYANDEEWSRYPIARIPYPYTRRDAEEHVAGRLLAPWDENPTFAVVLAGTVVGDINLRIDPSNQLAEIGYSVSRQHWGRGLVTEAAREAIDYGFREFNLAKVFARADERNIGSWRVMEKLGMTREGTLRSHSEARDGTRRNEVLYGVLRREW